jgi:hypothetical protein
MFERTLPIACSLALGCVLSLVAPASADEPPKNGQVAVNDLSMEIAALHTLHQLKISPAQLEALRQFAKESAQPAGPRQAAKASEECKRAMTALRNALVDANDDDLIDQLRELLDELRENEKPEFDDGVELTEAARRRAPELLRLFSARQIAFHVATMAEELPDPTERVLEALDKVRGLPAKEWKQLREDVSEEIGRLAAGLDLEKATRIGDKVVQLLIQARALKEDEFKAERPELEKKARELVGDVGPIEVLRHVVQQSLAELLSNPRLMVAIDARLKK